MTTLLRESNCAEVEALIYKAEGDKLTEQSRKNVGDILLGSTRVWVAIFDGNLTCAWGIIPPMLISNICYLWMYTIDVKGYEFRVVRYSQLVIQDLLKEYQVIVGVTKGEDRKAIKWLEWLGAKFQPSEDGVHLPFRIEKVVNG